ncbi:MAG: response regulator [Desulfobacterales bacterium]
MRNRGGSRKRQTGSETNTRLKPHMLLLDINMPLKSGKEALAEIERYPRAFVIMLTSLTDKETVEDCITKEATKLYPEGPAH